MQRDDTRAFLPYPAAAVPHAQAGPLHGLTFAVKDLFDVAGYPTGAGNPFALMASGIKPRHAPAVQRLLDAGARFVGKVVTDEFAFSINGNNAHFGAPVNGAVPARITGGSSSGSASAVSCGMADTALGTDTGGSVRIPASHCGLFGIRPSQDRVDLAGCHPLAPSFDTGGFFARDAVTFGRVADVLLGDDPAPLPATPRALSLDDAWDLLEPAVRAAFAPALARVTGQLGPLAAFRLPGDGLDEPLEQYRIIQGHEAWQVDGPLIQRHAVPLGPGVAERFAWAATITDAQRAAAERWRADFRGALQARFGSDAVLVLPTAPDIAPLRSESEATLDGYRQVAFRILCIAGLCGLPQVTMPIATRLGAPLGLSLIGPAGSDRSLVALAGRIAAAPADV